MTFTAALLMQAFAGCGSPEFRESREVVSVSISPLEYFVDRLTGNNLEVNVMLPPGVGHGSYSPSPGQFERLSDSGIYFRVGYLGYERAFIGRLKELNPSMKEVNLSEGVELIRGPEIDHGDHVHEGGIDPHIWMSPSVMLSLLPKISGSIIEVYPHLQETVEENYSELASEIEAIHRDFERLGQELPRRSFMIFHPALTYLARDYGFEQIAMEHDGKEPSPRHLGRLVKTARDESIPVIFIQQEYDVRSAQLISQETGAAVVPINPLSYDWMESMHELKTHFETHLR